jgi:hypothetical protein
MNGSKSLWWSTVSGYGSIQNFRLVHAGRKERQGAKGTFGKKCEEEVLLSLNYISSPSVSLYLFLFYYTSFVNICIL